MNIIELLKIFKRIVKKRTVKKHQGLEKYNLSDYQVYPAGKNLNLLLKQYIQKEFSKIDFNIEKKMAAMGTCFAEEISKFLSNKKLNYIKKETNVFNFSANWGRVYTTSNLHQIVKYSNDINSEIFVEQNEKGFFEPIRDHVCGYFKTEKELLENIKNHRKISNEILKEVDVLFITLGQTEVWYDNQKKFFWGNTPSYDILKKNKNDRHTSKELSFEENYFFLKESINLLKKINSKIKIIITLSPVPAKATFKKSNIIIKSFSGKALLKCVIDKILNEYKNEILYFPSFEMVICDNLVNFQEDNRHVSQSKIDEIFSNFEDIVRKSKNN